MLIRLSAPVSALSFSTSAPTLAAWLLNLAAAVTCLVPSPARDLKTGELLARETACAHGRRGSWADMLRASWWPRGSDWGGREAAAGAPAAGLGSGLGAAGTGPAYERRELPAGTAYRDEPRYGYKESEASRERAERERLAHERERERPYTASGAATETERERLQRESHPAKSWLGSSSREPSAATHETVAAV